MNKQSEPASKHELYLLERKEMRLCGVKEVLNFDDQSVRLMTSNGELTIEGNDIHIGTLDTEHGVLTLQGTIDGMYYANEPIKKETRLFGKLFGK